MSDIKICDCEKAYEAGRADMKKEIIHALSDARTLTIGIMQATLTGMIEKVEEIK